MSPRLLPVPDGLDGERVDAGLARLLGLSRTRAADLVAAGAVIVEGRPVGKSDRLVAGTLLEVDLPGADTGPPTPAVPVPGMTVLFEDDDVLVVDKPVGVAAHPSPGWDGPTVVGGLAAAGRRVSTSGAAERQGVVHRLDVGTTGVMAVAKSERAYTHLKEQFRRRTVEKRYHALVQGHPDPTRGTIDAPVGRHPTHPYKWAVVADGRPAVTHYETLEAHPAATLLDIRLETGRTHQIRVHMAAVRHPCVGDPLYGADPVLARSLGLTRQWLHAAELGFAHPADGRRIVVRAPYPDDLREALARL
ncbi:MAG: RluA family pseudouridine synthase [Kineosporiaceae bacterium]